MNFLALYDAANWAIIEAQLQKSTIEHNCTNFRVKSRSNYTNVITTPPFTLADLKSRLNELIKYYTMLLIYDECWICGKVMLPLDLDDQWCRSHPEITAPDWTRYER